LGVLSLSFERKRYFFLLLFGFETQVCHLIFLYAVVKCISSPLILLSWYVVMINVIICEFKFAIVFPHMITLVWIFVHIMRIYFSVSNWKAVASLIILAGNWAENSCLQCDCFTTEITKSKVKMSWETSIIIFGDVFLCAGRSEISWTVWIYDENTSMSCY